MGYVTRFTSHAQRDMLKVPRPDGRHQVLQGHSARWRFRVGDYRVVYTVEDGQLIVWVLAVGNPRPGDSLARRQQV